MKNPVGQTLKAMMTEAAIESGLKWFAMPAPVETIKAVVPKKPAGPSDATPAQLSEQAKPISPEQAKKNLARVKEMIRTATIEGMKIEREQSTRTTTEET